MTAPEDFMARAAALAVEGMRAGEGGPFGAVVVRDGRIVGEGANRVVSSRDPTAHAEIVAIRAAARALGSFSLAGCELYTTCEPCPMCLGAIHWSRIERAWYANDREDAARIGFDDALLYREVALPLGERSLPLLRLRSPEAEAAFREWRDKPDKIPY